MKQLLLTFATALLITGTAFSQDKGKNKACCQKDGGKTCCKKEQSATAKTKACCMQPSKTASLRMASAKPVKKETAVKP
ncbi:hypothetical protein F0L74_02950 [Chitinophaga agrisoli]|uniref:Uncharacterized protein n=1 Tax=Chitinophaga agrisoli TaxID=2607653 RepID=A0A5B2W0Q6_9BACT|nr:hypothetical protein [Chitinophaga agrisoli]KAA2244935.1 hypothetical protein F0L74_02950 [Chitinophaga agrisoli]